MRIQTYRQTARQICCRVAVGLVPLLGLGLANEAAYGQDAPDEREEADAVRLDPVIVNARKVEEDIQRIPFGISVFGPQSIERQDIGELRDFARDVPGLNFVDIGLRGGNVPNIRGVGSFLPQSADDSSVPVFIDGVPLPVRAQDREFFDIEQIEVLRGPQNSLYGRNAQAGAINITTASPTFEPFFEIGGEVGNLEQRRVSAIASGPLTENLAGRIGARFQTRDGDIPDINLDDDARDQDIVNATGKLLWLPGDDTDITFAVRYSNYEEQPTQGVWLEDPDFPQLFLDTRSDLDTETLGAGLTVQHEFEDVRLTSVTGAQYYNSTYKTDDSDGLAFGAFLNTQPVFFNNTSADFRSLKDEDLQLSQELRLDGELANGTRWLAGINVFRADFHFDVIFNNSNTPLFGEFANEFATTSAAVFGEATVPLTDRLRASAGLRYTNERKDFDGRFKDRSTPTPPPTVTETESRAFNLVTGRAALTYDVLPQLTGFASVARGAKAGGFQILDSDVARGSAQSEFDTAYTWTYEAGVRGTLFDGILDVSASAFFNDTKDEHIQVFNLAAGEGFIENVDTETYGVELQSALRPITGLTLSGGLALLDTKITKSDDPSVETGNEVPFAPPVAFNLAGQYEYPVELLGLNGSVFGRAEYQYVGSRFVDPENSFDLGAFDLVNLRAGWDTEAFSIYAFVNNLFDQTYAETAFLVGDSPFTGQRVALGIPGQPRTYGFGARFRF